MGKIENVLQSLYAYISHSPKRIQKFVELANVVETRGCIFKDIKTQWSSMIFLATKVLSEYRALVLKMHQDFATISQVAHNLQLLCDLEAMLGLSSLMPMLEGLNELIKFSQSQQCLVCDFVFAMKLCQANL